MSEPWTGGFDAIDKTAYYQVAPEGVDAVSAAVAEFVACVSAHEPGTRMYAAWQQQSDPTRFVHLIIFEDETAQRAHRSSDDVRRFEEVYGPLLAAGPVVFTDYLSVASNSHWAGADPFLRPAAPHLVVAGMRPRAGRLRSTARCPACG